MKARAERRCAQAWEVEAARDGRLSGDALDAVARHLVQCAECRELASYFDGLGEALRGLEDPAIDDLAVRRLRQTILGRADAELAGRSLPPPHKAPNAWRWRGFAALAAASLVIVGLVVTRRSVKPVIPAAPPVATLAAATSSAAPEAPSEATTIDATDEGGARWTKTAKDDVEWVDLTDGTLRLQIHHAPGSKRVIVRVPDGEIEDLGTTFHIVVRHGRTQRVGVDEGRVTIRLHHMAPITISSGSSWEQPEPPAKSHPPPAISQAPLDPPIPADAAREDAAYLRTISLLREGRTAEAKVAARDYLQRFPHGFRREEMARTAE